MLNCMYPRLKFVHPLHFDFAYRVDNVAPSISQREHRIEKFLYIGRKCSWETRLDR